MKTTEILAWLLAAMVVTLHGADAQAMTMERVGDTLFATGNVDDEDFLSFNAQLATPGLHRLVLVDSPGGSLFTALRIGNAIRDAEMDTVAVGNCLSACSVLFVAGKNRAFGSGRTAASTLLGIHGGYNPDSGQLRVGIGPALYAFFRRQLGAAMDDGLVNEAIYGFKDPRGLLVLREIEHQPPEQSRASLCLNASDPSTCKSQDGKDAFTLGLVTQRATVALDLPPSMHEPLRYFGVVVKDSPMDFAAWEREALAKMCPSGKCPDLTNLLHRVTTTRMHRAIAWNAGMVPGQTLTRVHASDQSTTPAMAMFEALYGCNHRYETTKLCRMISLDDQDLRPLIQRLEQQARDALSHLPEASPAALASEKTDVCGGELSKQKPLASGDHDTAPPCALRGVERIDSARLVTMLQSAQRPIVVDVGMDDTMVPGAIALLGGGVTLADDVAEVAYHQRFMGLVRAAAPDLDQPLVFYAGPRGGWLSAHAALRAVQAGHTRVYWYRGGLPAWTAAGLPTVGKVALGVVY